MMISPEDAADKWCPLARVSEEGEAGNRWSNDGFTTYGKVTSCIGPACMAWCWEGGFGNALRWKANDEDIFDKTAEGPSKPKHVPPSAVWVPFKADDYHDDSSGGYWEESDSDYHRRYNQWKNERVGYCGAFARHAVDVVGFEGDR